MTRTFQDSRERSTRATPDSDARSLCVPVENVRNDLLLETSLSNYARARVLRPVAAVSSIMMLSSAPSHPHLLNGIRVRHFLSPAASTQRFRRSEQAASVRRLVTVLVHYFLSGPGTFSFERFCNDLAGAQMTFHE
jgi:hypothetical protein